MKDTGSGLKILIEHLHLSRAQENILLNKVSVLILIIEFQQLFLE